MKTVVIGSAGQLGRDLVPRLPGKVICWTRADADLTKPDSFRANLAALRPDRVVNCAAYNFVDKAESELESAFSVNAWGVRALADVCQSIDATLVHFSTDYVFGLDTSRRTPSQETDAPGPVSAYGLSKVMGEYWVRQLCPKHFVIRTCGLYGVWGTGGKGGNFVETMLRLAQQGKPLRVVNDQRCTPSFTADIAAATADLLSSDRFGLYHVTNAGDCCWYEFALEIFRQTGMQPAVTPITSAELGAAARRPSYSVLSNATFDSLGLSSRRSWQEALGEYLHLRQRK